MSALTGLVLLAHGARDPGWARPFEGVVARLRADDPRQPVALAFLEAREPTLAQAARGLAGLGCTQLHVLPLLLGAGSHLRRDVPRLVDELRRAEPDVTVNLLPAVGEDPRVVDALLACARTAAGR